MRILPGKPIPSRGGGLNLSMETSSVMFQLCLKKSAKEKNKEESGRLIPIVESEFNILLDFLKKSV